MLSNKEQLKDGKVLEELVDNFFKETTIENMHSILLCIVDSDLQVPMSPIISDEDKKELDNAKLGDKVELKQEMRIQPDILLDEENNLLYFPIFSNKEKATKEYSEHVSWINMNIDTVVKYIEDNNIQGIVLNPMTDKTLVIEDRIYELLKHILTNVRKEENNEG